MKIIAKLCVLTGILLLCTATPLRAQRNNGGISFNGTVYASDSEGGGGSSASTPLPYAVVSLPEIGVATTTDIGGRFEIRLAHPGKFKVEISSLGFEPLTRTVEVSAQKAFSFTLKASSFYLEDVVVAAESKKTGAATASKISKSAMDHIQATSLADVMSLLPGADLRTADQIALKRADAFSVRNGQSFGTAVIMDGAPISNNANMQTMSMAIGATAGPSIATPNSGIDMRTITTNNIESVEVIRGIASAQYGDIASGAVIVNSKAGRAPLSLQLDVNPNVYMASASHGIGLGRKAGVLNYGLDYTFAQYDPTEGYDTYNRITGRVGYSNTIGKWTTNTSFDLFYTKDKAEPNPDDERDQDVMTQRDLGLRFNTNGTFNFNRKWFKNLRYTVSANYTSKKTYSSEFATNSDWTYSTSKTDGAVLSSLPGQDLYYVDAEGNKVKITNISDADKNGKAWRLPSDYTAVYDLYGKELNTFAQVTANFAGDLGRTHHRLIIGGDYRATGNLGEGKVFDPENPPRRKVGTNFTTQRERAFKDVPFMHQFGLYAEEYFSMDILRRKLEVVAGVRYDHVYGMDGGLAPRINASYDVIPEKLSIRGGYGITFKAPSLGYLYPDNAYFDILNFDNSSLSGYSDAQKFQIATTHVYSAENPDLELAKTEKWEVGADFKIGQVRGSVTYFEDKTRNGYMSSATFDSFKSVDYNQYKSTRPDNETDLPELSLKSSDRILLSYSMPTNYFAYENKGIEFDVDFGRVDAIRTSFGLNGNWTRYKSWVNYYTFDNHTTGSSVAGSFPHMGVFEPGSEVNHSTSTTTNLRITHNIPRIGFVVTLTVGVKWHERSYTSYKNDSIPVKYISRLDGKVYDVDPSRLGEEEFQAIDRRPMLDSRRLLREGSMPPLVCFNINLTKEISNFMRISFFANNMFRSTPIWESDVYPGSYRRRNSNTFFFGAALSIKIR